MILVRYYWYYLELLIEHWNWLDNYEIVDSSLGLLRNCWIIDHWLSLSICWFSLNSRSFSMFHYKFILVIILHWFLIIFIYFHISYLLFHLIYIDREICLRILDLLWCEMWSLWIHCDWRRQMVKGELWPNWGHKLFWVTHKKNVPLFEYKHVREWFGKVLILFLHNFIMGT